MAKKQTKKSRVVIPKKMRIGGRIWRIKRSKTLQKRQGLLGVCVPDERYISIDCTQTVEQQHITFLHELLHAIFPQNIVGDKTEENIVSKLEEKLHNILVYNRIVK